MSREQAFAILRATALSAELLSPRIIGMLIMAKNGEELGQSLAYLRDARRDARQVVALIELAVREFEAEQQRVLSEASEQLAREA